VTVVERHHLVGASVDHEDGQRPLWFKLQDDVPYGGGHRGDCRHLVGELYTGEVREHAAVGHAGDECPVQVVPVVELVDDGGEEADVVHLLVEGVAAAEPRVPGPLPLVGGADAYGVGDDDVLPVREEGELGHGLHEVGVAA